jgi:hypothetical protein
MFTWNNLSDQHLLGMRIRDLGLRIEDTSIVDQMRQLHAELECRGMVGFRPQCYLSAEWCTVDGETMIGVPFYLAHPRLAGFEQRFMGEVEGGSHEWGMKLLRHEAGHCFDHAYRLSRTAPWKKLFGDTKSPYDPDHYQAHSGHPDYVEHLDHAYAQAHPDEDFAETFAVWLTPNGNWRRVYAHRPVALAKLLYVDQLSQTAGCHPPRHSGGSGIWRAERLSRTLAGHYEKRVSNAS